MDGRPDLEELARNYGFSGGPPIWPNTVDVRRTPSPGVMGFVGWGPMYNVRWLGEFAADSPSFADGLGELVNDADFGELLRASLSDDPEDDRAAAEIFLAGLEDDPDLGIVPALIAAGAGVAAAVAQAGGAAATTTGIITAAGALASTTAAVVAGIANQRKQEIAAAEARGASAAEIRKIKQKYGARKRSALRRSAAARRQLRARMRELRRQGMTRRQARKKAVAESKRKRPGRRRPRREPMPRTRGPKSPEQIARETEQIAAGFSLATDIMRRTSAHVAEVSGGYSVDPFTGETVRHRPVTETVPAVVPPSAAPPALPQPSIMDRLRAPAIAGIPWWGVLVIGGAGALLLLGRGGR